MASGASLGGGIVAHGPGDWIDYSAWTAPVTVNLTTNSATGVAFISGIQNVRGGNGGNTLTGNSEGNVLIGGAGNDVIAAGSGRSILIGVSGTDTLSGGAASDLLVGGTTSYDNQNIALASILAEWQSTDAYVTRVTDLLHGGGLNGPNALVPGSTVNFSGATDKLTGGAGQDFFLSGGVDTITDFQRGELVN